MSGNISRFHGYFLDTMANGGTAHYRYQGTTNLRDGKPYSATWSWTLAGGSGKLKNVTGKGSCRGAWDAERVYKWHCVGGYQLGR